MKQLHFSSITSTNSWAKEHLRELNPKGITLIIADQQTGGRGRFERRWHSPSGLNIYASFCFFVPLQQRCLFNIAQLLSLSTLKALQQLGFKAALKWPNDLLISGKKIAGILCETISHENNLLMIAGIGLNVNMSQEELNKLDKPATSLFEESGKKHDVAAVLKTIEYFFEPDLNHFLQEGFDPFFEDYEKNLLYSPGQSIEFYDGQLKQQAIIDSLNKDGSLSVILASGEIRKLYAI